MNKTFRTFLTLNVPYLFLLILFLFFYLMPETGASAASDSAVRGKKIFAETCSICHTASKGGKLAHDMEGMPMGHEMPHDMGMMQMGHEMTDMGQSVEGEKIGHDISGVTKVRERQWLIDFISDPGEMVKAGDPLAVRLLKAHKYILMPGLGLKRKEIYDLLSYLESPDDEPVLGRPLTKETGFSSATYLQFHKDINNNFYAPVYEYVDAGLKNLADGKLNVYSAGWFRYNMNDDGNGSKEKDELTYAYMNYSLFNDRSLLFTIGRQFVFDGIASEQIDGFHARWELRPDTGFSIYGGIPIETESDGRKADFIYGSRVFQRIEKRAEAGVSFLREDNNGASFREELGIDLWLMPADRIEIQGLSSYNNLTKGWMEHSYDLRFLPSEKITLRALFSRVNYADAFFNSTLSVFSPDFLGGPNEKLKKTGVSIEHRVNKVFSSVIDFSKYAYSNSGDALHYGITLKAKLTGISAGASVFRMDGNTERLRYTEARIYASKSFYKSDISIDATGIYYDTPYDNVKTAYFVNGTASYRISRYVSASICIEQGKNPDFTNNTRMLLSIAFDKRTAPLVRKYNP